jgi:hypothetical protein
MQPSESTRGRLNKRPRANTPPPAPSASVLLPKTAVLPQIDAASAHENRHSSLNLKVYEDEILEADSPDLGAQNESTPVSIGPQTGKIWPHITVDIPSRSDFLPNLATTASKRDDREPLSSLLSTAINGARKAPQIPKNRQKISQMIIRVSFNGIFILFN